jgi:hypothetical protein
VGRRAAGTAARYVGPPHAPAPVPTPTTAVPGRAATPGWRGDTARPHPYVEGDDAASARRAMGRPADGASDIYARSIAAMNAGVQL